MSRPISTSLAFVLLLALPLASLVTSGHVHERPGAPTTSGAAPACACVETASVPQRGPDCDASEDSDQRLCPICELAKSLHTTGLPALLVLSVPSPIGFAPAVPEPRANVIASIHPTSRSPPVDTTTA
jgi:hypothetical protein